MQGQVGNAATEARAQGADAAHADRSAAGYLGAADVITALDATPFVFNTFIVAVSALFRSNPGEISAVYGTASTMAKMHATLTGDQLYSALETMRVPAPGRDKLGQWLDHLRQATSPPSANVYASIFAGADAGDLERLLAPARDGLLATALAQLPQDPLTLFPALQTGLSAAACASARFVAALVARAAPSQIWRAVQGTGAGHFAALGANLNAAPNGWNWLDGLTATALTPAEHAILGQLHTHANATGQGKITTINATAGVPTPGVPFATALTALQTATPAATAQAVRALLQTATHADRAALFSDAAKATWLFTLFPGNPLVELSIGPADRAAYLANDAFFVHVLNHATMSWTERVGVLFATAYINSLAARFSANDAAVATFITSTCPGLTQIGQLQEFALRRVSLLGGCPLSAAAITAKFDDQTSSAIVSRPPDAEATQNPLQRIDALLATTPAPANLATTLVSMIGALGALRTTVSGDAARMTAIRTALSDEQWFQALVDLQLTLGDALTQLRAKGHSAARLQTFITRAGIAAKMLALRDDANIAMVRADLPQDPLALFLAGGALEATTFDATAWRTWVLEATPTQTLLPKIAGNPALAAAFARKLDAASAWGFLARCPNGPALLPAERQALERLRAATGVPSVAADIRAKTSAATEPATPVPAPPGAAPTPPVAPGPTPATSGTPAQTTPTVPPPAPTKLAQIQAEIVSPTASATRFLQLSNEITQPERNTLATAERARIIALLSAVQLVRFVQTLPLSLPLQLGWIRDKGGTLPIADVTVLLTSVRTRDRVALFDDVPAITALRAASNLGPLQTMGLLETDLPALHSKVQFWEWAMDRVTGFEILRYIVRSNDVPGTFVALGTVNRWTLLTDLPAGTGLPAEARAQLDTMFAANTLAGWATWIFEKRFNVPTTGWAVTNLDDIRRLYRDCQILPIAHVANDPRLIRFQRGTGGGGSYQANGQINVDQDDLAFREQHYTGRPGQNRENYFDHTVRHEIGHAVDAMLGEHTSLVYGTAGWTIYTLGQMDNWINSFGGWNAGGGATPSAAEQQQIRDLVTQLVQSGGGQIDGPNAGARDLAPQGHAFHRFPQLKLVEVLSRATGTMKYLGASNRLVSGGKVYTINYYYRQFMECNASAGINVPRDYCMFSPAEWFADMYAEFYRQFDGERDATLGGNCPAFVRSWFLANVHAIGGRSPSELHGRPLPRGHAVHR